MTAFLFPKLKLSFFSLEAQYLKCLHKKYFYETH